MSIPVIRSDGKRIRAVPRRGHLFVCALGCCCGHTEDGFAPVASELYHIEWERRRLRNAVHLTQTACLGQCSLANVVLLLFDGQSFWFHSMNTEEHVLALYDYIEAMLEANCLLTPPLLLADNVFNGFVWSEHGERRSPILSHGPR
jgi:cobaltochelatase CobN